MSINTEMTALADAIRAKAGTTEKLTIAGMTTAVDNIQVGGSDIDLSFITAEAGDIRSGKVGADTSGNPVTGTLDVSGGGSGTFDLAKVTEYSPATPEITAVSSVAVSGIGTVAETDRSAANGTYTVTDATSAESDWKKRVYQNGSYYLYYYEESEGEGYWYLGESTDGNNFLAYYTSENIASGANDWENWDYGETVSVSVTATTTTTPASGMVLKGVKAKGFNTETKKFIVGTTEVALSGAYTTPKLGDMFVVVDNCIVGNSIASDVISAIPTGFTSNTSIDGYVIDQSSGSGSYSEAWCIFNQNYTESDYAWWTGDVGVSENNPAWFSIEVPEAFAPTGIWIMNEIVSPQNFKTAIFQGSNDNSTWDNIYTISNSPNTTGYQQEHTFVCETAYKYFRMLFTASHSSGVSVQAFKIYKSDFIVEAD